MKTSTRLSIRTHSIVSGETDQLSRGLIDTNIVILLATVDGSQLPEEMVISTVTLAELSAGPHHAPDAAERTRRISILQHAEATFDPLPFDAEAARVFGRVCAAVLATGRSPRRRIADLLIASTAIAHQLPVYTTNPDDFAGLAELATIIPVDRPARP